MCLYGVCQTSVQHYALRGMLMYRAAVPAAGDPQELILCIPVVEAFFVVVFD